MNFNVWNFAELEDLGQMYSCQGQGDLGAFTWLGHLFYLILPLLQHLLGAGSGPATAPCTAGVSLAALVRRRKCYFDCAPRHPPSSTYLPTWPRITSSFPVPSYHGLACYSCPLLGELLEDHRQGCSPLPTPTPPPTLSTPHDPNFARPSPSLKTALSYFPFSQSPLFGSVIHKVLVDSVESKNQSWSV